MEYDKASNLIRQEDELGRVMVFNYDNLDRVSIITRPDIRQKQITYDEFGNIINRHCHHESARRGARTGTQGIKGTYDRSKIPQQLCQEVIESLFKTKT